MKRVLLFIGIIMITVSILSLMYAGLNLFGYYRVLDGSAQLYNRLHQRMIIFLVIGIILAVTAAACFLIRSGI